MGDLVLLRDLIKSPVRGQTIDLNVLFRHLNFDSLFECIMARPIIPFPFLIRICCVGAPLLEYARPLPAQRKKTI